MIESTATDGYASGAREPSLVALGKVHSVLNRALASIAQGHGCTLPQVRGHVLIARALGKPLIERYVWLKWADAFIGRAGELIRQVWPLLKSCAYDPCSRLFVSDGKRIYCTDRCAERDRQARFRPKRSRDRAAEYQRRTAKRLGLRDNAKIRIGRKGSRSR